jgi:diguanylate cyclase (GGDEF)-like protein
VARPKVPVRRPLYYAWFITGPLLVLAIGLSVPVIVADDRLWRNVALAPVFVLLVTLSTLAPLRFEVRRQSFAVLLTDIPLLLALFYLSPFVVLVVRLLSSVLSPSFYRQGTIKLAFNLAGIAAGTSLANLIVFLFLDKNGDTGPHTWAVLGAAVFANQLTMAVSVGGVILLLQGGSNIHQFLQSVWPGLVVVCVNITLGLVMLLALQKSGFAILLLVALAAVLGTVYRAYAQFLRQHKSLSEMYDLTRVVGATVHDGTLPDVLLCRVRALMQAESATLWLPEQGRHPETLLSARFDYPGLLDSAPTPDALRLRALHAGETVFAGPKHGAYDLRAELRKHDIKDVIVVPLRSATVVIGTLEVAGRVGDQVAFSPDDVRLLETLAAHVGVAVENSRLVDRLRFDANNDPLTGLANRHRMLNALDEAVDAPASGEVVAVLLFDVVALRQVNESLGHAAGDKVLIEVAKRLRTLAPNGSLVARVGGDEFAVELRTATAESATAIAEHIQAGLRDPMVIEALTVDINTNAGVAVHPDHGTEPETLLRRADVATHVAKSRGTVQLFNPGLESRSVRRLGLAGELRAALRAGELEVYFQPKVALRDRRLVGVECLARWDHPVHGSVSPEDFVAVAEHTGQLAKLTELVLRDGLGRARKWIDAGRSLSVSVNVGPRTLADADFPVQVAELLGEYQVAPDRLTLEITEIGMLGGERPLPALHRLRDVGVLLSIDDFGTGHSPLAQLHGLPVQEIKIDRTFVQGAATDPGDLAIVRTIVDMTRHFGLTAVAEGVESEFTLGLLEDIGCDIGQGFLFSRPLPYERFDAWLQVQADADPAPAGEVRWLRAVP